MLRYISVIKSVSYFTELFLFGIFQRKLASRKTEFNQSNFERLFDSKLFMSIFNSIFMLGKFGIPAFKQIFISFQLMTDKKIFPIVFLSS